MESGVLTMIDLPPLWLRSILGVVVAIPGTRQCCTLLGGGGLHILSVVHCMAQFRVWRCSHSWTTNITTVVRIIQVEVPKARSTNKPINCWEPWCVDTKERY